VGGSLIWDCPEGRPDSVTSVTVFAAAESDDGTAEGATTGSAAIEANPDTTFDGDSGDGQADPRVCAIAATTGIVVGREYLLETATGLREWAEVVAIDAGVSATVRHPLSNAYVAADTFVSTRITIAIDGTWAADENNVSDSISPHSGYRVRWVYVVDGTTCVHDSYFDLLRYDSGHSVTREMIEEEIPGFREILPTYHSQDQGSGLISAAWRRVQADLAAMDLDADAIRSEEILNLAVVKALKSKLYEHRVDGLFERFESAYQTYMDQHFRIVQRTPVDVSGGGAAQQGQTTSILSR